MKYFLFAMLLTFLTSSAGAQDFFVPDNAFGVAQDRLASPVKNADKTSFSQRRYRIIDGRVYPIEDDSVTSGANTPSTQSVHQSQPSLPQRQQQKTTVQATTPNHQIPNSRQTIQSSVDNKDVKSGNITPLASIGADRNIIYQDLFKTYKDEREKFKKQHKFPKNQKLEDMLAQFKTPHSITLFQNKVE